jgi:hypothetical protein
LRKREILVRLFLKSPLFRLFILLAAVLVCVTAAIIVSKYSRVEPVIDSVDPPVATGGDIIMITGKGFFNSRGTSFVEIGGNSITESSYLQWTDSRIVLRLPPNVKDGLLSVVTQEGKSEPKIFANSVSVPLPIASVQTSPALPNIVKLSGLLFAVGRLLVIYGENFGDARNASQVRFTPSLSSGQRQSYIVPCQFDFDYESWTDSEIRVRVPDSAVTGTVSVVTEKGVSNAELITIDTPAGKKNITAARTYLISVSADISNVESEGAASIILRVPRPLVFSLQPSSQMRECSPLPVMQDYNNMVIHQLQAKQGREKSVFTQNFVITVNGISTEIAQNKVPQYADKSRALYKMYTAPDALVQSRDKDIVSLAKQIVNKETNPYAQARLVYEYLLDTFTLLAITRSGDPSPLDMLATNAGDAYDFSVVYASLLRALGIPCVPVAGVLAESDSVSPATKSHWWNLFYLEDFGWVPVDAAMGAGMTFGRRRIDDSRAFYFGSIDSLHIAFSNGWKTVKPSLANSKAVYRPRSYAFQSIWEEASISVKEYSSYWNEPAVIAIY